MSDLQKSAAPELMKLLAFDADDLSVISAKFQDAIVCARDMVYLPHEQRFALIAARFDWVAALDGRRERCWAGLHFERVRRVTHVAVPRDAPKSMLNLLAIGFEPLDPPSGHIILTFSGKAAVRLDVECIEAQMRDTGPRWRSRGLPGHPVSDSDAMAEVICGGGVKPSLEDAERG